LPDIQSSGEAGIEGVDIEGWVALFGPGGMDPALADQINADFAQAMATASMQQQLVDNFAVAGDLSAAEFAEVYRRDLQTWDELADAIGLGN